MLPRFPGAPIPAVVPAFVPASRWLYLAGIALVGELAIRPLLALTLSDLLFLMSIAAVSILAIVTNTLRMAANVPPAVAVGAFLFTLGGLVSSLLSAHRGASLLELMRLDYLILVWIWLGPQVIASTNDVWLAVKLWTYSAFVSAVGAFVQLMAGDVIPNTHIANGRMTGLTQQVNDLGGVTAIALAPSLMLATLPNISPRRRIAATIVAAVILCGLLLSGSVTGFAAAAASCTVWFATSRPNRRVINIFGVLAGLASLVIGLQWLLKGVSPFTRILLVFGGGPRIGDTSETRLHADAAAVALIRHHPLIGIGLDDAGQVKAVGNLVHNILLEAWLGGGVFAFAGVALLIGFGFWVAVSELRKRTGVHRNLMCGLLGSMTAFLVFGLGAPVLLSRYAWLPVALLVVVDRLQYRGMHTYTSAPRLPRVANRWIRRQDQI